MAIEIKAPRLPESVSDATLVNWHRSAGDAVCRNDNLADLETDKVVLEIPSPTDGVIKEIFFQAGATVGSGDVLALLEPGDVSRPDGGAAAEIPAETVTTGTREGAAAAGTRDGAAAAESGGPEETASAGPSERGAAGEKAGPGVRRLLREQGLDASAVSGSGRGGRITKSDVLDHIGRKRRAVPAGSESENAVPPSSRADSTSPQRADAPEPAASAERAVSTEEAAPPPRTGSSERAVLSEPPAPSFAAADARGGDRAERRVPMTRLRARIAERLVEAQHSAAMLTTFNEVDMSAVMAARGRHGERFRRRYDVKLGFMSFFVKASVEALRQFPVLNASVDGGDIVYHEYVDIGVAVSTDRGLVVPILRDAEAMTWAGIEKTIVDFGERARSGSLGMQDLTGGTFTLTNGGIFGSMMSTPIINPPQSGILGMHAIRQRPVAVAGEIEIRPMMYVALTYDHRIVDGREAVQFLVAIKEILEDPARLLLQV